MSSVSNTVVLWGWGHLCHMLWERVRGVSRCSHCTEKTNRGWIDSSQTVPLVSQTNCCAEDEVGSHYKTPQKLLLLQSHWVLSKYCTVLGGQNELLVIPLVWNKQRPPLFLLPFVLTSYKPKSFVQTAGKSHLFQILKAECLHWYLEAILLEAGPRLSGRRQLLICLSAPCCDMSQHFEI